MCLERINVVEFVSYAQRMCGYLWTPDPTMH